MAAVLKKRALAEFTARAASPVVPKSNDADSFEPLDLKTIKKPRIEGKVTSVVDLPSEQEPPPILSNSLYVGQLFTSKNTVTEQVKLLLSTQIIYGPDLSSELLQVFDHVCDNDEMEKTIPELVQKLLITIRRHDDEIIKSAYVGCFRKMLLWEKFRNKINCELLLKEIVVLIQTIRPKLVVAELLALVQQMVEQRVVPQSYIDSLQLIQSTSNLLLASRSHLIKRRCLSLLSQLAPVYTIHKSNESNFQQQQQIAQQQSECLAIIKTLRDHSRYFDCRVRCAALSSILTLHKRGIPLDISLYTEFCDALKDNFEECRIVAIRLLEVLSSLYADCLVCVEKGDDQIRLIDDAFAKICQMVNDLSKTVRTQAASILGNFRHVSVNFLEQTLDKKLMSNLKLKKSAHERNRESCDAGEWASGRKWASDAPRGDIAPDTVNLMNIGACGAFIHGLEDEFSQVRMASLDSLCKLAEIYPTFAKQSLDFFVDMLNDEIEEIRVKAIFSLGKLGQRDLYLRYDQLEIILPVLKDSSSRTREALHQMLGKCRLTNSASLQTCIQSLLDNLRRYPEDKPSIWICCQHLGRRHPQLTASLANELLGVHSFFDLQEPSLDDHDYIAILILIVNAAALHTDVLPLFERYKTFAKHYVFLKDAEPELVPVIKSLDKDWQLKADWPNDTDASSFGNFLADVFGRVQKSLTDGSLKSTSQNAVVELATQDLRRFAAIEPTLANAADFARMYLQCQTDLRALLTDGNWINAFLLPVSQTAAFRSSLHRLLRRTFRLIHQFNGLHPIHLSLVYATRVKTLALQLVAVIHGSNASALTLCDAFLDEVKSLQTQKTTHSIKFDALTEKLIKEIGALQNPKPGSVARVLQPLMLESADFLADTSDITGLFVSLSQSHFKKDKIKKSYAQLDEPKERTETPLKFTSGLVLTLKVDARLYNIKDIRLLRLKIHFADKQNHLVLPRLSDFRRLDSDDIYPMELNESNHSDPKFFSGNFRLQTSAYISHGVWSDPCFVELSLVLDFRETLSSAMSVSQTWALKSSIGIKMRSEESLMIDLCKPVKILIAPKLHKKGIFA